MIHFFRKIRYQLSQNNQFFKYLKYAVGEIILVVLGILIALSVSKYNQSIENKQYEAAYLEGIRSDLQKLILDFNESIALHEQRLAMINELLDDEVRNNGFKRNDSTFIMFNILLSVSSPTEIKTTFTELLFSGDLNLIRNESLKNDIVRFYQNLQDMVQRSGINITDVYLNHLFPILIGRTIIGNEMNYSKYSGNLKEKIDVRNYPKHVKETAFDKLEDPDLELELVNALNMRAVIEVLQKDRSIRIIENAEKLIGRIESELRDEHDIEY